MKRLARIGLILAVGLVALVAAKNLLIKTVVTRTVKAIAGLDLRIQHLDVGFMATRFDVQGLQLLNPPEFAADRVMVDMPELYVDYELGPLLRGQAHLEEVRLNLRELTVVRNAQGRVNLNSLQSVKVGHGQVERPAKAAAPATPPALQIDQLDLRVGKVVYKDYSSGTLQVREFPVNIHERFRNINNPYVLAGVIVSRSLARTTIAQIVHFDLGSLQGELVRTINNSLVRTVDQVTHGAAGQVGEAVTEATGTLKKLLGQ